MAKYSFKRYTLIFLALFIPTLLWATPPSRIFTYSSGSKIDPAHVTANEDAIFNYLNNLSATIADDSITTAKILDGTIVNADISTNAGITFGKLAGSIPDSKLDQILSISKVAGTALTGLANVPSGAGELPVANIPTINLTNKVSETLPVANGGTGATAAANAAGGVVILDGSALVPIANIPAITPAKGGTGHTKIQSGSNTVSGSGNTQINFSEAFSNTNYVVTLGIRAGGDNPSTTLYIFSKATGSFTVYIGIASCTFDWIAIGD